MFAPAAAASLPRIPPPPPPLSSTQANGGQLSGRPPAPSARRLTLAQPPAAKKKTQTSKNTIYATTAPKQVILSSLFRSPDDGVALQLYISANNTVALFVIASVTYGIGACAVGQLPRLPLVAEAADSQVRGGDY